MKIDVLDPVSGTVLYALMAGAGQSPEDMRRTMDSLTQRADATRGEDTKYFDRGNNSHSFTFSCTRAYNTIGEAEKDLMDHPTNVPGSGTIRFTSEANDIRYLHNAVFEGFSAHQAGLAIVWTYHISGGLISNTL